MDSNGREFWDDRYMTNPQLGSGLGSRGENLFYKRGLLEKAVALIRPENILDIGCGDQYVSWGLPDNKYTGLDISSVVITKNRKQYPERRFIVGDFLTTPLSSYDMTVCFDVVIHLEDINKYRSFIERLVNLTDKGGIISGYENPVNEISSFVHFHEPLSETLRRSGVKNFHYLGKYRGTSVYYFSKQRQIGELEHPGFKPVFLVGTMRSGTTLLATLLGAHPGIVYCPFELKKIWSRVGDVQMASPKTRDTHCPALSKADVKHIQAVKLGIAFQKMLGKNRQNKRDDALFLNKNPHLCNKLPFVNGLFPGAKFIWLYRDLTRVTVSLKKLLRREGWHYWPDDQGGKPRCWEYYSARLPGKLDKRRLFPGGDIRYLAEYWYESNKAIKDFSRTIPSNRLLAVREEDLIENPQNVLANCQGFLGVDLIIPMTVERIDKRRNELWVNQLAGQEIQSLMKFIMEHKNELEKIMGKTGITTAWERELENIN